MHSFPKSRRITARNDFVTIGHRGKRQDTRFIRALLLFQPDTPPRLGITVTKKVGNAVQRNRIKRAIREAYRHCEWPPGLQLVLIANHAAAAATGAQLRECVAVLSQRVTKC